VVNQHERKLLRPKRLLAILAIAGAYYLTAFLGLSLALPQTNATAVWLSSGIALAALLLGGAGLWPGVALGALLANAHVLFQAGAGSPGKVLLAASIIAGGNTLEALLGRWLFRRYIEGPDPLHCSRDPLILATLSAVSCIVAATVGVTAVTAMGLTPRQLAGPALLTWWLGDLAGILVITPLVLVLASSPVPTWNLRRRLAEGGFLVAVGLAAFELFAGGIPHDLAASVAYLVLPLVLGAAIWGGPALTQLSVIVAATVTIYGAVHGQGPFARPSVYSSLLLAQAFICVLALAGSTLAAAIAERQMREQTLNRTYRALQVLTRCDAAVVHATKEQELLQEVCRVAVDTAGYHLACVGYAEQDEARTVRPMAYAGPAERFLSRVRISWGDNEYGQGTFGSAIRTARPVVAHDLLHHPQYRAWHDLVAESGFRSAAAVPLQAHGTMYGAIVFYTSEPYAFGSSELDLLVELGANLAHGILTLRTQRQREQMQEEVVRLHEQVQRHAEELEQRVEQRTNQLRQEMAEREQAQTSLRESERKYRELVENANSIILRIDTRGCITFLNEFGQRFFGYREEELLGRSVIGTIVPPSETGGRDLEQLLQDIAAHPDRHTSNENENVRRDGTRAWISWTNRPIEDGKGRLVECLAVGNDITALKQAEVQLERAKEAAESADRLKSAFLATMSHELRTPLNSIIGFTGILLQGLAGPLNSEQRNQLGMVQIAARHLLALITDVLDISKIEAGQLTIQRAPFSLSSAINKVMQTVTPLAQNKNLQLVCQVAPDVREFLGDQRRVEQILLNLLSNAIKFTEQGNVTLCCTREPEWVILSVRDTGCGIAGEDQQTLFRPFRQLDTGLARKHEGTGLGLAICKRLADLMGGQIELSSVAGKGSVFTVKLPQQEAPAGLQKAQQENL
jgi:PAS domain S-box-containing protein